MNKVMVSKLLTVLKWGKISAKLAAMGTTAVGAFTALSTGSTATGMAMGAAGVTTYAATKNMPAGAYEKTKHIAPGAPVRGNLAGRAILEAVMKPPGKSHQAFVLKEPMKFGAFLSTDTKQMADSPFAWTNDENQSLLPEEPQSALSFHRRPVMMVTTEEEEVFDEGGKKRKKIRTTALKFIVPDTDETKS